MDIKLSVSVGRGFTDSEDLVYCNVLLAMRKAEPYENTLPNTDLITGFLCVIGGKWEDESVNSKGLSTLIDNQKTSKVQSRALAIF